MNQPIPPSNNPYSPPAQPQQPQPGGVQYQSPYAACPNCRNFAAVPVNFTLWGGVVGPKMLTHVRCQVCGNKYNGKTGRSNMTAIVIYNVVAGLLAFALIATVLAIVILGAVTT